MKKTADIVIIGGGIIGVSVAYHLARMGAKNIVLFEKDHICEGSTALCAGGIRRQFTSHITMEFAIKSFEVFQNFKEEFGVDPQFRQVGYLFLATSSEEFEIFKQNIAFQNRYGVPSRLLSQDAIRKLWPYLNTEDVFGGAYCETDGYASPHEVTHAIARKARDLGVEIIEGTEVTEIEVKHGRVVSVRADGDSVETRIVVNAAGPYAAEVGRLAGIDVPVKPIRRQLFVTDPFERLPEAIPLTIDHKQNFYFRREGKAVLLSGPQDETPSFNLNTDFDSMVETAEKAMYRVPVFEHTNIARGWGGLYEISPDNNAILGSVPEIGGFILANGFSGHGFQHGPVAGMVIAEVILKGKSETIDIKSLSYERFKKGKLIRESLTAFHD
ncbi:MAG: FAD-binding oxidoreductase [Deltaproteobacteria bacterium]|nr:FAD-binding oxidoreductase [Deltaproteobacteria bacterium]MBW1961644.1 FAD-binding oxidoreductase [Deltaproteobacteria bacterium]MBW2151337.1 FAD-binding oxidoreductase [Deltaproteobacteria bacterium]